MPPSRGTQRDALQARGIRRAGGPRNGFRFRHASGAAITPAERERIARLRIPPAWRQVLIAASVKARVQAIGLDAAGRWQYLYLRAHALRQSRGKFDRLAAFGRALPALRASLRRDLARPGLPRERAVAAALLLLSATALRPGNDAYARANGTFGLATLRPRHVSVRGERVRLDFRGKHGVRQLCEVRDRRLAQLVVMMLRSPGRELFKFRDARGRLTDLRSDHLNDYVQHAMGARFSARSFRTWTGTLVCAAALKRPGVGAAGGRRAALVRALQETARVLGNTPAVTRESYVHPAVIAAWLAGRVVSVALADPYALAGRLPVGLHRAERALLELLELLERQTVK